MTIGFYILGLGVILAVGVILRCGLTKSNTMLIGVQQLQYLFNNQVVYDDMAFLAVGAVSSSDLGTCNPGYPTTPSPALNNAMLCFVGTKTQYVVVDVPTGWRRIGEWIASPRSNGSNAGPVRLTVLFKESDGTESGTLSVSAEDGLGNSSDCIQSAIYTFSKDPSLYWDIQCIGGAHNNAGTTAYSARSYSKMDSMPDDLYMLVSINNGNTIDWSLQGITQPGVTFETVNQEILESDTSAGNNMCHISSLFKVLSGTVEDYVTYAMTGTTSTSNSPIGITGFLRIRQSTEAPEWAPSGLSIFRGRDMLPVGSPVTGDPIFNGNRAAYEGPDSGSTRYGLDTFNGRTCMRLSCDLTTGVNRRTEINTVPNDPRLVPGSQMIEEIPYETDDDATIPLLGWLIFQHHTGTAPDADPEVSNSPLFYFGWAFPGEGGWDNYGGTAVGGEFMISQKVSDKRYIFPSIMWGPNKKYTIRYHVKLDYAGSACFKVWMSVDGGAMNLLHENYTDASIPSLDSELGVNANVGGHPKKGLYLFSIKTQADVDDNIDNGFSGLNLYISCMKLIVQRPSDIDYITDLTDNDNPIYDWVDTSTE